MIILHILNCIFGLVKYVFIEQLFYENVKMIYFHQKLDSVYFVINGVNKTLTVFKRLKGLLSQLFILPDQL